MRIDPSVLNDITNGSSKCLFFIMRGWGKEMLMIADPNCGSPGFQASKGWDPVTGLGTPNYPKMLEYFLGLP
jgi:tripeptidyl-peptidase-1